MKQIELAPVEEKMLGDLLEVTVADLSMEISHTDSMDYREGLKTKKEFYIKLARQLKH